MKSLPSSAVAVASCCALLAVAPAVATNANAVRGIATSIRSAGSANASGARPGVPQNRRGHSAGPTSAPTTTPTATPTPNPVPSGCDNSQNGTFIGIPGESSFVGDNGDAVLGGSYNSVCVVDAGIGAGEGNAITTGHGSNGFIAGGTGNSLGGGSAFIGAGDHNTAVGDDSFVGGGTSNAAPGLNAFVGGGTSDAAQGWYSFAGGGAFGQAEGDYSFVGGGEANVVLGSGAAIVGGGSAYAAAHGTNSAANYISGIDSFVGAGDGNFVYADEAFVGSGYGNTVAASSAYSLVAGGRNNTASAQYASVLGGFGNAASGTYSAVTGGNGNTAAGMLSEASGYHADAVHNGTFVWSDYGSGSALLKDSAANQFVTRASGGYYLYSNEAATSGVMLAPGSGTWASLSDRNAKVDVVPLDDASILAKVASLPVSGWRYATERGTRHVGPMAQDFYAAFGVGSDDRHVTSVDEDGVALAAIKELNRQNVRLRDENARMKSRLATFERRLDALASRR